MLDGLIEGYTIANYISTNQSAAYELQLQNLKAALNASEAQREVQNVELQAKDIHT